ncbi:uncharacterized protein LOC117325092 [Pecten maximus]|uniref:uncharacterized protein LOC117325092 n=1 Tax=Pecten maximus TaxID=6579 RepID=UPI00145888B0|nr:uncharacterized protein LOC117325092 [Pecten maximus]
MTRMLYKGTILRSVFLLLLLLAYQTNGLPKDNAFKQVIKGDSRTHILLMLRANSTYGLDDVMSNTPPCPGMSRSNSSFTRQVIDSDYYGSSLLDQWKEHTPVHLSLLLTNYRGTILWSSSFVVTDRNSSRLDAWFQSENIVLLPDFTDYLESPSTLTTNFGTQGFLTLLQQTSTNNTAYLGIIQRDENTTHCSKMPSFFYFSNSTNTPFKIRTDDWNLNMPLTQIEVLLKTTHMTDGNETKIDFENTTGFVTAVRVHNHVQKAVSKSPCLYKLKYSTINCEAEKYHTLGRNRTFDCGMKEYLPRGVLRLKCLIFALPDMASVDVDVYGIGEPYIAAPVLMVLGHYDHNPLADDESLQRNDSGRSVKPSSTMTAETTTLTILTTETVSTTTIISTSVPVSIDQSISTTLGVDDKTKSCCFCDCSMYTAYYKWHSKTPINDKLALTSVANQLKANTTVKKTALSSYVRRKTCASDPRPHIRYVGTFGILLLVMVLGSIILADIASLRSHIGTIRQDIHGHRRISLS